MKQNTLYDISTWNKFIESKPQKGSRPNNIYENPKDGDLYYFKQSKARMPTEIWSEIIASKIGQLMGFNVLDYNIAINKEGVLGCLSKSMINKEINEELYHGVDILNDHLLGFIRSDKPVQSFQDLQKICANRYFEGFLGKFLEMIIFDAVIGNTDRHTENWAFIVINNYKLVSQNLEYTSHEGFFDILLKKLGLRKTQPLVKYINQPVVKHIKKYTFSPIYDSGCCLGREKTEAEIQKISKDTVFINNYLRKANSDISWDGTKISLLDLVSKINQEMPDRVKGIGKNMLAADIEGKIKRMIIEIDQDIEEKTTEVSLSKARKEFIINLLLARLSNVKKIIYG